MEQNLKGRMQISGTIVMTHKDGSVTQQPFSGSVPVEDLNDLRGAISDESVRTDSDQDRPSVPETGTVDVGNSPNTP